MSEEDVSPLQHRVAGCHSGTPSNILTNKTGQILKPYKPLSNPTFDQKLDIQKIINPKDLIPVTLNELQFYAKITSSSDSDYEKLRKISPKYFGSRMISGTDHLLLEDFTHGMVSPCVMDLKIGRDRYYPGRTAEKAKQDTIKYPCLREFGFCIAGIKLCNPDSGDVEFHYMPKIMRKFSSEEVAEHVRKFLHFGEERGQILREILLSDANQILDWASAQRSLILRGSSLLFVYDAASLKQPLKETSDALKARVGMIDFAHAFHSFGKEDTNYVTGMKNLVHVLKTGKLP